MCIGLLTGLTVDLPDIVIVTFSYCPVSVILILVELNLQFYHLLFDCFSLETDPLEILALRIVNALHHLDGKVIIL